MKGGRGRSKSSLLNTRHLIAVDKALRGKKLTYLETVVKDADTAYIQEVQQDSATLLQASPLLMALFYVHFAEGPGGVVTLWKRSSFPDSRESANFTQSPYVQGRVLRVSWTDGVADMYPQEPEKTPGSVLLIVLQKYVSPRPHIMQRARRQSLG